MIPRGYFKSQDAEKVISINKKDLSVREYPVPNNALANVVVNDNTIYTNSNLNYETHISMVNRENNEFTEKTYPSGYFTSITKANDKG